jgi:heparan-alpha-glucosaminide N-acetyltransferase
MMIRGDEKTMSATIATANLATDNRLPSSAPPPRARIASIDVFRGLVMFLMLLQMVQLPKLADKLLKDKPGNKLWETLKFHTEHVVWEGGSLHDLIQPGFSFLVGSALAFSVIQRRRQGQSWARMFLHALLRSGLLITLGVLLRNLKGDQIVYRFEDTLCQIGLGYAFLFVIATLPNGFPYGAFVLIVVGWWIAFVSYPTAPKDFDYVAVGVMEDWPHHKNGLAAHWNKNANLTAAFDRWFLNLFPRDKPFMANEGGYGTLSFVPTLATMILGLIAGTWLREEHTLSARSFRFLAAIGLCFASAYAVNYLGWCPIIKRLWTPTWVLWSGGWCLAFLYVLHLICDVGGVKFWAFPLTVIGSNSIAAYVMSYATVPFLRDRLNSWLGFLWKESGIYEPHILGAVVFGLVWLVLYWMHRQKLYIRL